MKNIDDFLNEVNKTIGNDNRTATFLHVDNAHVGNWRGRRSMPSNKHVLALCDHTGISVEEAIRAVEYSREFERPLKQTGFADIGIMAGMSLSGVTWLYFGNEFIALAGLLVPVIHYAKSEELELDRFSAANDEIFERGLRVVV